MDVPDIVQSALDGEKIASRTSLGGEDELFITPSNTIIYRGDGLISDESIDTFPHDAERLTLSEGRRKTRFSLEYPLDDAREFTVPSGNAEDVLHPVLAGILNGNGITDAGETVVQTYRFSELTLIVTSDRLVKHIGGAVWDDDYEEYHFGDVTNLSFEEGSVATQIVVEVDGRPQWIKAPNEQADDVCEHLQRALFAYHDVASLEELNLAVGIEDEDDEPREDPAIAFDEGVDPLDADPPKPDDLESALDAATTSDQPASRTSRDSGEADTGSTTDTTTGRATDTGDHTPAATSSGEVESDAGDATSADVGSDPELVARLEDLEAAVARQNALLEEHQETMETLIDELRQGR